MKKFTPTSNETKLKTISSDTTLHLSAMATNPCICKQTMTTFSCGCTYAYQTSCKIPLDDIPVSPCTILTHTYQLFTKQTQYQCAKCVVTATPLTIPVVDAFAYSQWTPSHLPAPPNSPITAESFNDSITEYELDAQSMIAVYGSAEASAVSKDDRYVTFRELGNLTTPDGDFNSLIEQQPNEMDYQSSNSDLVNYRPDLADDYILPALAYVPENTNTAENPVFKNTTILDQSPENSSSKAEVEESTTIYAEPQSFLPLNRPWSRITIATVPRACSSIYSQPSKTFTGSEYSIVSLGEAHFVIQRYYAAEEPSLPIFDRSLCSPKTPFSAIRRYSFDSTATQETDNDPSMFWDSDNESLVPLLFERRQGKRTSVLRKIRAKVGSMRRAVSNSLLSSPTTKKMRRSDSYRRLPSSDSIDTCDAKTGKTPWNTPTSMTDDVSADFEGRGATEDEVDLKRRRGMDLVRDQNAKTKSKPVNPLWRWMLEGSVLDWAAGLS